MVFKVAAAIVVAALLFLNVAVVSKDKATAYLEVSSIYKVLADESGASGASGDGTLYFKEPKETTVNTCPKVTVSGQRWQGVSGSVAVGTVINGATVTVNASGEKGYWENYSYQTDGKGKKVECPDWNVFRTCTPGTFCPGTGDGPYL